MSAAGRAIARLPEAWVADLLIELARHRPLQGILAGLGSFRRADSLSIFVDALGEDDLRLTAPLTAISAAVVGVIASLAIFFARHVFRLSLSFSDWDVAAMAISAAAAVALLRFRAGTIPVIAGCAAAGLVVSYLR